MDEGIDESEMEKLIPEWSCSRDKVKHSEKSDQLFFERMMSVAEQE